ncbi:MAG: efflux RND transporter permease subunit [Planctomycetaceae bacterium]|nr:efflux RND transporter permease subunit [Planctomycetaceae bacterium]
MFLANVSVRRPIAVGCLIIALVALGLNAYRKLALENLPKIDVPYVTIQTVWPGASPGDIEKDVAKRIEDAVSRVDGLKHVTSSCMENACLTQLEFQLGVNVDVAATDVRERLDTILGELPADVERPVVLKLDINAKPIVTLALTGNAGVDAMYDFADNRLRDRISVIRGVANVELVGGSKREVHVLLDRAAVAAAGMTSLNVVEATRNGVMSIPSGRIREGGAEYAVRFDADYDAVAAIDSLEVANNNGSRRYIRDMGTVQMASQERRQLAFIDGQECISIRVVKKAEANTVQVVSDIRQAMAKIAATLPGGMKLIWISDDGQFVQASVDSTLSDIVMGIALTAAVLLVFLANLRTTVVVSITMPLTILISLWFMQLLDFTLNLSTLLAIGLSTGILVSNSIVVLENVVQRFADTHDRWEAARKGTSEVAVAVLASAGTNVVVMLPIGMMGSMVGLFFRPFAVTTLIVNTMSLLVSFTLTPILCALLLKPASQVTHNPLTRLAQRWDAALSAMAHGYARLLHLVARRRWLAGLLILGVVALLWQAMALAPRLGFSFVDNPDRGQIFIKLEYPTRYDLAAATIRAHQACTALRDLPDLRHILMTVGKVEGSAGMSSEGVYLAQTFLVFADKTERSWNIMDVLQQVRSRLANHTDCIVTASVPSVVGGQSLPMEMEISGEELPVLDRVAMDVQRLARGTAGVVNPDTTVRQGKLELRVHPRRAILADQHISAQTLAMTLRANLEGIKAGSFKRGDRTYDIRVKFAEKSGKDQVEQFLVPAGAGRSVVLANFADVQEVRVPVMITRVDKQRVVKMVSDLGQGATLSQAVKALRDQVDARGVMPAGYGYRFAGEYERMADGMAGFAEAGILAVLLTYLMLAAILESFTRPLLIMVTVPLGAIGAVWALYMTANSISMFVLLGLVMLVGIVVNIAVLIFDRLAVLQAQGIEPREAMMQAIADELRPVLMVTLAAVLGMLPMAIGTGLGSEMRAGIGIASVGGIASSALLTLVVLPVGYLLFTRSRR